MHIVTVSLDAPPQSVESVLVESTLHQQLSQKAVHIQMLSCSTTPYAIHETALVLKYYAHCFAQGSFHIMLSNFYENYQQYYLIAKYRQQYYIAPNNGILSLIAPQKEYEWIYKQPTYQLSFYTIISLISENVAQLLESEEQKASWEIMLSEDFKSYIPLKAIVTSSSIQGHIMHIDSYGNAITNITRKAFEFLAKNKEFTIKLSLHTEPIHKVHLHYNDVPLGELVAFFNDMNLLEIAINQGNVSQLLGLRSIYQKDTNAKSYQTTVRIDIKMNK